MLAAAARACRPSPRRIALRRAHTAAARPTCVLFDLGGVILDSPFDGIAAFEAEAGLAPGAAGALLARSRSFARLERGELSIGEWTTAFEAEAAGAGHAGLSAGDLMARITAALRERPQFLGAVANLRARGLRVGAVTNNWRVPGDEAFVAGLYAHFETVVESCELGVAKPDPAIYLEACRRLDTAPASCVFLDDIGRNCKAAAKLGMAAIRVRDPEAALGELGELLDLDLA